MLRKSISIGYSKLDNFMKNVSTIAEERIPSQMLGPKHKKYFPVRKNKNHFKSGDQQYMISQSMKDHYKNSPKLIEDFFIIGIDNK